MLAYNRPCGSIDSNIGHLYDPWIHFLRLTQLVILVMLTLDPRAMG